MTVERDFPLQVILSSFTVCELLRDGLFAAILALVLGLCSVSL